MTRLAEIVLFTNKVCIAFDENGMSHPIQEALLKRYSYDDRKIVETILKDNPDIKIARWQEWVHKINDEEFCLLVDMYDTYKEIKRKEETNVNTPSDQEES